MMAAPFDPTSERNHARGLAHQFRQDAGLIFPDDEAKHAKARLLIARLRAAGRPRGADVIEAMLDAWAAVHLDLARDLADELDAQAGGFARPEQAPA